MEIYDYLPFIIFFACEIALLLCLYRFLLRGWIIESITDNILELAPDAVLKVLKHELLANTGNLTRVSHADPNNTTEVGLEMAEMALKELGIKKPGVIMTMRMGQQLLNLYNNKQGLGMKYIHGQKRNRK